MKPVGIRQIGQHGALAAVNHDEAAREDFIASMYFAVQANVFPGNRLAYDRRVRPEFERGHGRAPEDRHEIRRAMAGEPLFQWWSGLRRTTQEMKQATGEELVHRQIGKINEEVARINRTGIGTLRLDPGLPLPGYASKVDFHGQPGGYYAERCAEDTTPAAIYDPGVFVLTKGFMGPYCEAAGASAIGFLRERFPDFEPKTILDIGCSVGHSTVPYSITYPEARIDAIDLSAPMLRYGYARANSLGHLIHFSQQNAEATDFPSGSFDLVVSHIVLHETSRRALRNIFAECQRLLAPGGLMLHVEQRQNEGLEAFEQFYYDWDTLNNHEPFWGTLHDTDLAELAADVGFATSDIFQKMVPNVVSADLLRSQIDEGQDFKRTSTWLAFGAQKKS
ncbi:MAG: class I SAM-dependent methyltransferase [Proteobacteria bacterium]|nr:class I SAM-dependent methyltransferase [Pseudomonadota bacterium]MDA1059032.1 class I SAM-dependent methyltransferase [Pseudomonadota bacterium]